MNDTPITVPDLLVVRNATAPTALRAKAEDAPARDGLGHMDVRFSPFNVWYRIDSFWEGSFMERTVPGAFKRTFAAHNAAQRVDAHNVKTLFNHGADPAIGDKLLGDVDELSEDEDGARSTVWLWDTSYNRDLLPGLRSGAYGSSFMFRVVQDEWNNEPERSEFNPDGIPERTLKEVRVFEAGPVTFPASPTATAGMRAASATDAYYEHLARRDPNRVDELRARISALRDGGPANAVPHDPPSGHSRGITPATRREFLFPFLRKESSRESG